MRLLRPAIGALTALAAAVAGLALAAPAYAHVTVHAQDAVQGGYTVLTFRVPTESDTISTTGLKVQLPLDQPLASVLVQPQQGWSYHVIERKLAEPIKTEDGDQISQAITEIDWRATAGGAIKPGQFGEFRISVGPLPKAPSMTFKAIQVYSDGSTVSWTDLPAPGSTAEPAHPAPMLTLSPAADPAAASPAAGAADGPGGSSDTVPLVLAVIALVIALGAAGLGVVAVRRRPGNRA